MRTVAAAFVAASPLALFLSYYHADDDANNYRRAGDRQDYFADAH